jgi:predicted TIM-barrel fold metal-dependent hydrolase
MGHLYGNSGFREGLRLSVEEERARLAAENDHVAREAGRYPGRATALCSVSVLRPYAWDELRRCRSELGAAGIKLHLASSEVDLRNAEHLAAVERVVGWAVAEKLVLLVHLDPQRPGTEAADVERFARAVLQPHPDAVLIVAHLGGSGGYGPWTRAVFRTLLEWLEERARAGDPRRGLFFDVSAALLERESEGVPATTADEAAALGDDLHRAGVERLLFGSDHPVFDPRRYAELLLERAVLTPAAAATLLANRPPSVFSP